MPHQQTIKDHIGHPPTEPYTILVTSIAPALEDDYTTILEYDFNYWVEPKIVVIRNIGSINSLNYSIYGAISAMPDNGDWVRLVGDGDKQFERTLAPGTPAHETVPPAWRHLRVKCKNDKAGRVTGVKIDVRCIRKP